MVSVVEPSNAFVDVAEESLAHSRSWLGVVSILAISASLPLALRQSHWVPGMERMLVVSLAGALVGLTLASRARRWWVWPAVLLLGAVLAVMAGNSAWPLVGGGLAKLKEAWRRLAWWAQVVWAGGKDDDSLVPLVAAGIMLWITSLWLAWVSLRHKRALLAAAPAGTILAMNTFFGMGGAAFLLAFVPFSLILMMQTNTWALEGGFQGHGTQYADTLRVKLLMVALPCIALVTLVGFYSPYLAANGISRAFWQRADKPWRDVVRLANWFFPGLAPSAEAAPWLKNGPSAAMPEARQLQGQQDPGLAPVMYVRTSDPPPMNPSDQVQAGRLSLELQRGTVRYWRGMTYDTYDGRGWANSHEDIVAYSAGQSLQQPQGPRVKVTQEFQIIVPRDELIFSVAEPVSIDAASRVRWRGPGDMAYVHASIGRYTVVSEAPNVTVADLSKAGAGYPAWVTSRYLQVPNEPDRVVKLAQQITESAVTPYDKLVAIEAYLRRYEYDLNITQPAEGKDVVDYFLFEGKKGYCDYFASSMVVLAREVGIPTRLASGYVSGTYDFTKGHFVVTERDAHSWPEAYFPGIGWVQFEPTSGRAALYRPQGDTAAPALPATQLAAARGGGVWPWVAGLAGTVLIGSGGSYWLLRRRQRGLDPVLAAYAALERNGRWLGLDDLESQTPREFASNLADQVTGLAAAAGWTSETAAVEQARATAMETIAFAYERRRYAAANRSDGSGEVPGAWRTLQPPLRRLVIRRLPVLARQRAAELRSAIRRLKPKRP
jgi:transglutaminase-like putative cysteine protease